jgi:hypothetical protein
LERSGHSERGRSSARRGSRDTLSCMAGPSKWEARSKAVRVCGLAAMLAAPAAGWCIGVRVSKVIDFLDFGEPDYHLIGRGMMIALAFAATSMASTSVLVLAEIDRPRSCLWARVVAIAWHVLSWIAVAVTAMPIGHDGSSFRFTVVNVVLSALWGACLLVWCVSPPRAAAQPAPNAGFRPAPERPCAPERGEP